ncbi:MAG TPA: DUF4419 domain-containing protein, partial [Verrucomicrobiota bacterium]|nr:DUF4419 domain-containing protein [Verrucomicrobiota bacterium]
DRIVRSAQGGGDRAFWQSFYKTGGQSGGPWVTGWINVLFPYLMNDDAPTPGSRVFRNEYLTSWEAGLSAPRAGGPLSNDFPTGLSCVPFTWEWLETQVPMRFTGGFVGVSQDEVTGAVRPAIGWAISER